jgi:ATP-dependent protease HslVU (ClpYQ) peptidase subunit
VTIVVAYKDHKNNKVWLGSDSQGTAGTDRCFRLDEKVFISNGIGYGFTDSFRMGQILRYHSEPVQCPGDLMQEDPHAYTVQYLVPMWRKILKEHGYTSVINNEETAGTFVVTFGGNLFTIECDFQVGENADDYSAIGCGYSYAYGSLYTTAKSKMSIQKKMETAIEAACYWSSGCGGEPTIINLPY